MYGELISRPVPATKTGQAPSRQYRATPSVLNILVVYLVSSSGVAIPSLTSEGSAMSPPSLGSAVGSRFTCGSPWNRKGMVSFSVLSTNRKQASPQSVHFHVNIRRALISFWDRLYTTRFETLYVILLNIHKRLPKQRCSPHFARPEEKKYIPWS